MRYVDGFVLPVPREKLAAYRRIAELGAKIWREHGALEYRECVGDDMLVGGKPLFPKSVKLKRGETVIFSWIVYRSRKHRDRVNAKVMADPRICRLMEHAAMPYDMKRMVYGGFKTLVEA